MKVFQLVIFLLFTFIATSTTYADDSDTYKIKIETISQDRTTISQDIEQAFHKLIKKLTNKEDTASYNQIMGIIEQYQYIDEQNKQYLLVEFDKTALNNYLKQHQLNSFKIQDEAYLLYVAQIVDDKQELLDQETNSPILNVIKEQALKQGFNLITPTMDLDDIESLSFNDVWQQDKKALYSAAKRYHAKGILVLQLYRQDGNDWHSNWHLYQANNHFESQSQNAPVAKLTEQGIQQLQQQIHTFKTPAKQVLLIQVRNSNSNKDYKNLLNTLQEFKGVEQVQIDGVTPGSVLYKLTINTDKDQLINKLSGLKNIIKIEMQP